MYSIFKIRRILFVIELVCYGYVVVVLAISIYYLSTGIGVIPLAVEERLFPLIILFLGIGLVLTFLRKMMQEVISGQSREPDP